MQTDRLLDVLVADLTPSSRSLSARIITALSMATSAVATLFLVLYGVRDEGFEALGLTRFIMKLVLLAVLAGALWHLVIRAGRPVELTWSDLRPLGWAFGLWGLVVAAEAWLSPREQWPNLMWGQNHEFCLQAISIIGLPILLTLLLVLRYAAPAQPMLAGALCGWFSAALAGLIYALHCPDDSSFFVIVWYGLSMGCLTLAGLLIGRRILKW